jgi:pimeloyl-ACP methyl ester carboxylesterase
LLDPSSQQKHEPKPVSKSGKTVVVLIHGIRTAAWWQSRIAAVITEELGATVIPLKYGYFDLLRFLCPFGFCRREPIERLRKQLQGIRDDFRDSRIVVFAHSYGTYALSRILSENPRFTFHRVILCGSIIKETFDWDRVQNQILTSPREDKRNAIINECGIRDIWPVFAKSISWGYGATGTYGFGVQNVRDRFHPGGHSAFFNTEFVRKYWIPAVAGLPVEYSPTDRSVTGSPIWFTPLRIIPIRWVALVLLALIAGGPKAFDFARTHWCIGDCASSETPIAAEEKRSVAAAEEKKPVVAAEEKRSVAAFRDVSRRNGVWQGIDPIPKDTLHRLSSYYEVVYADAKRPIEINARNGSASLTQGFGSITEDSFEGECSAALITTLKISYKQNGTLDSETLLDQGGNVVERIQYPSTSVGQFVDAVFPCDHGRSGIRLVRFERDVAGNEETLKFIDKDGHPRPSDDGIYGERKSYNGKGREVYITNLGPSGQNWNGKQGFASTRISFNTDDLKLSEEYFTPDNHATTDSRGAAKG